MHGPREEVGGGGRWLGLTLKITSSIGNIQELEFDPHPWKMFDPLWNQKVQFSLKETVAL